MSSTSWEQSVEKARLASLKTFEGRLEIAAASFEQIPPNGKGVKREQSLATFAEEARLEYSTLRHYRDIAKWWGDCAPLGTISWSTVKEARASGRWKNGSALAAFVVAEDPPEDFASWTLDALRVWLGRKPTNTGKLALKAKAGEAVNEREREEAAAKDTLEGLAPAAAATVAAETLDSEEVLEALDEDENAQERIFHVTSELAGIGKGKKVKAKKGGVRRKLEEMLLLLDLMALGDRILELARDKPDSPLLSECVSFLRNLLETLENMSTDGGSDAATKMQEEIEVFLAGQK